MLLFKPAFFRGPNGSQIWFSRRAADGAGDCARSPRASQAGNNPSGIWLTQNGDAKIKIGKCGGAICGVIVWLREPIDSATGKPAIDDKNPDPKLARRPMLGLPLFSGMRPSAALRWSGTIYNADDGKTYDSHIALTGPDELRVEGCVGPLCGGETWTRAAH